MKKSYSPFYQILRTNLWYHNDFLSISIMMTSSNGNIFRITGPLWGNRSKGQWRGALMFSLICAWTNVWTNNRDAGDLRCHHAHYDIIVMYPFPVIMIYLCGNIHTWLCITSGAYVLCCLCTCAGYIFIVCKHISQINVTAIIKIPFMLENWHYVTGVLRCLKSLGGNSTVCSAAYSN